jgi:hypothetical protein
VFKFEPGCKLDKGCNLHISLEEGLVTEGILKVPESYDIVPGNIVFILLRHRIETSVAISNEGYDMEQTLFLNLVERLTVPLIKGVVPTDGS